LLNNTWQYRKINTGLALGAAAGIMTRVMLNLAGIVGAVWGPSEAFGWRKSSSPKTSENARFVAYGALFLSCMSECSHMRQAMRMKKPESMLDAFTEATTNPYGAIKLACPSRWFAPSQQNTIDPEQLALLTSNSFPT
jgi:hypothetical protein